MNYKHTQFTLAALVVSAAGALAGYVDFTGLGNSGGTFTTDVDGNTIPTVSVSAIGGTGTDISQQAGTPPSVDFPAGSLLRLQDDAPTPAGETMFTTITFPTPQDFTIVASPLYSNISTAGEQWVEITAINSDLTGFSWNVSGLVNAPVVTYSGANNETIRFAPTLNSPDFVAFTLIPGYAIEGFRLTVSTISMTNSLNSTQLALDVIPEPSTVVTLISVGLAAMLFRGRSRMRNRTQA